MTLEEAKIYKEKVESNKNSYLNRYLEFIYHEIKSCIDRNRDSCIVDFFIPSTIKDGIPGITIMAEDNEMADIFINKYTIAEIAKRLVSDGYDINVTAFEAGAEHRVELDDFISNFEFSDAKSEFFKDIKFFELEVSGW